MTTESQASPKKAAERVAIYDTTLRDGTQREGVSYTLHDKLRIAERLDAFGVDFIEGGWPGSNPKDVEFFARAKERTWKHAVITAFGSTRRAKNAPDADPNLVALIEAQTRACTVFGKSSTLHVTEVLRITREENLRMIEDSCSFLKREGRRVIYDAEHFFDGYRLDAEYALTTLEAAARGGAEVIVLCDTNGGNLPWDVETIVGDVMRRIQAPVGMHAHDDTGCGVANSIAAVRAGARHVQGTINGYGERCGNANLSVIIPNLELKLGFSCLPPNRIKEVTELTRFVSEVANLSPDDHMAYVGKSAFAHKGGVHVAAMQRHVDSYQHIDPALVGNEMRVVVSELSGRGNVLHAVKEHGVEVREGEELEVLQQIKDAEARGLSYEGAEASVALLLRRRAAGYKPPFELLDFQCIVGKRGEVDVYAEATVKLAVKGAVLHTVAEGNGPVSALDRAMRKALSPAYPDVERVHLADYKVRILDGSSGTQAITRVLVDSRDEIESWSTVGASSNIIEASMQALLDSIEYGLMRVEQRKGDPKGRKSVPPQRKDLDAPASAAK